MSNMLHPASCLLSTQILMMPELQLWKHKMRETLVPFNIMLKFCVVRNVTEICWVTGQHKSFKWYPNRK